MTLKNDLKQRNIQALDLFVRRCFAMTPILGNLAPERDYRQALLGKKISPRQQEVLARIEAKVGVKG